MSAAPARGRKVLAIRFGALGDLVLATCVLEALASESPPAEVHLLTKARFAPLFAGDPRVARVIAHSDGIGGSVSSLRAARRERYDLVLDLHATPRSRVIARAARAAERRAVDKRSRERRALVVRNPAAAAASPAPDVRLAGGVVGWYGEMMGGPLPEPRLIVPPGRLAEARALLERTGVREGFVAVAPFAARRTKEWLRDRMVRFLRDARRDDARMTLLLVGADADRDRLVSLASDGDVPFIAPPLALLTPRRFTSPKLSTVRSSRCSARPCARSASRRGMRARSCSRSISRAAHARFMATTYVPSHTIVASTRSTRTA
jgi:heptosyltransferase-2